MPVKVILICGVTCQSKDKINIEYDSLKQEYWSHLTCSSASPDEHHHPDKMLSISLLENVLHIHDNLDNRSLSMRLPKRCSDLRFRQFLGTLNIL